MNPHRVKISACWFDKRMQKLRHRKNTGQDWSRILKRLWKKPTLSIFSVSHSLVDVATGYEHLPVALGLAPFLSLPGRQAVTHIPEVPRQPVYPTGPCRAYRDLENLLPAFI